MSSGHKLPGDNRGDAQKAADFIADAALISCGRQSVSQSVGSAVQRSVRDKISHKAPRRRKLAISAPIKALAKCLFFLARLEVKQTNQTQHSRVRQVITKKKKKTGERELKIVKFILAFIWF